MSGFVSSLGGSFMQANTDNMSLGAKVSMSAVIGGTAEYSKSVKYFKMAFELDPYNQEVKEIIEVLEEAVEIFENPNNIY